jgi:hypothetical protein
VGLERGPLNLVSTIEDVLERKSSGCGVESREYGRRDPSRWPRSILSSQKLALTSPTSGGRSVSIVRSRTQAIEFFYENLHLHRKRGRVSWDQHEFAISWNGKEFMYPRCLHRFPNPLLTEECYWALFYKPSLTFYHHLLNVLLQIANKLDLLKKNVPADIFNIVYRAITFWKALVSFTFRNIDVAHDWLGRDDEKCGNM